MSFVKFVSKRPVRLIAAFVCVSLISSIGLASQWDGVTVLARTIRAAIGIGAADESGTANSGTETRTEPLFAPGTCDTAGPLEVEGSIAGPTPTAYATLGAAFAAINAGTHTGAITIDVCGDASEGAATAVLNASGTGAASYTSVTISPAGGAARTISGATADPNPLIDLNGADNVTIDGLNTGGNSLTISNTTVGSGSTIRFINDATNNTVANATISGSETSTASGTIFFSTTDGVSGNDGNVISSNNIGPAGASLPTNAVFSLGTAASAATYNSGIQITGNRIFDFFNAASASSGVFASTGSSDWTVSGNSLYQTAARTATTGATQVAILMSNTAGSGFAVTNNTIGGGDAAAGGPAWTVTGDLPNRFLGIQINAGTAAASSVQGNVIKNFNWNSSSNPTTLPGVWCGIYVAAGTVNVGTTAGNTVGAATGTDSITARITTTGGISFGIGSASGGAVAISNNNIGSITVTGANTSVSHSFAGIYVPAGINTISGNTIGSTSTANSINASTASTSATGGQVAGIISSSTASAVIANNTIANLNNAYAGTGMSGFIGQIRGIAVNTGVNTITGNTIRNLSTASAVNSAISSAAVIGISETSSSAGQYIGQNVIHSLSDSAPTAAVSVTGIFRSNGSNSVSTNIVERNFVHSLSTSSTGPAVINGIFTYHGGATYRNNMVRVGIDANGNSLTSGALTINGLHSDTISNATNNWYFNSVFVGGVSVTSGTAVTSGFKRVTSDTTDFRNNLIVDNRSNDTGTGKHYLMNINATAKFTSDTNVFFGNGAGAVFGKVGGLESASFGDWKINTLQDALSFFSDPRFIAPNGTAATVDLHINPAAPTMAEGNGTLIAPPADDFDGQTRAGLTPVDIGADAGDFTTGDLIPPTIDYTPLANTTLTTDRTLSITVTDISGVPAAGAGLPVLYFRKGAAGAYSSSQCAFTGGSNFDCPLNYAAVGGVVVGDSIQYYVAAQDSAPTPNVTTSPAAGAGGLTANPPAASTPPTAPNGFLITTGIAGTKTVCAAGCDYPTLTGPTGIFKAINDSVATGNINIEIGGDLPSEDGSYGLDRLAEEPAGSNFAIRLYPTGAARNIDGSNAGGLIRLNGADRVTLDGSLGGAGTDRSLTITQFNTSGFSAVVWLQSNGTDGATGNTIKNLNVVGQSNTTTLFGIGSGSSTIATTSLGAGNNGNTIQNNSISRTKYGIFSQGASAANKNDGNVISGNLINTAAPDNVRRAGVLVGFENSIRITGNTIGEIGSLTPGEDVFGISLGTTNISLSAFTGSEVTNATISGNNMGNVRQTGNYSAIGIFAAPAATGTNVVSNNMVSGVFANGTGGHFSAGIFIGGGAGATQIYFNSVSMSTLAGSPTDGSEKSYALAIGGSDPIVDLRNNILSNTQTNGTTGDYAVGFASATFANLTSDNNDFFVFPVNGEHAIGGTGSLTVPAIQWTFANLQAATGKDPNSKSVDPLFVSASNLHLRSQSPLLGMGVAIAGITTDIDDETRDAVPDIGADEIPTGIGPGRLQFLETVLTGSEGTTATFTVVRALGTAGAVTVDYTTAGSGGAVGGAACGTGADFVSASGTLAFADGQDTNSFTVQLCRDFVSPEPGEAVALTLSNPTGGAALGSNHTATLSIVDVLPQLSGSYNVPGDFPSLTNAGGIFERLNTAGVYGDVTINITADLTGELGTNALNAVAGGFPVTIKPAGGPRTISGAVASNALIRLNGASGVTIDGSLSGGTDRSLTIANTSPTAPTVVRFGSVGTTPITGDTLKNCIIQNGANTSSAVVVLDTTAAAAGYFNNLTIRNNDIQRAYVGIYANAAVQPGNGSGYLVTQNKLDNAGANAVRLVGIYVQGADGATVSANTVGNLSSGEAESDTGIWLAGGAVNSTVTGNTVTSMGHTGGVGVTPFAIRDSGGAAASGNKITRNTVTNINSNGSAAVTGINVSSGGTTVDGNTVSGVINSSVSTYGAYGINIDAGNNVVVKNNFVSNVTGDMTDGNAYSTTFGIFGIRIAAGTGHLIANNSVNLYGLRTGTPASNMLTAALAVVNTTLTGMDIRNNILANNITGGTTSIANVAVYLPAGGSSAMNLAWNNNSYYYGTDAARAGIAAVGSLFGTGPLTTLPPLAAYTAGLSPAGTNDNASHASTGAVPFAAAGDPHIAPGAVEGNSGATIPSVTNDYDGDVRPMEAFYEIGADEMPPTGTIQFSAATYTAAEGAPAVTLTVTRTGGVNGAVTLDYALAGGTATGGAACGPGIDYVSTGGSVSFANGDAADKTLTIEVCEDDRFESAETFNATLAVASGAVTLGPPDPAAVTIADNDAEPVLQFSAATYSNPEVDGTAAVTVVRTGATENEVSADYATGGGTATGGAACAPGSGVDYVSTGGTLNFAAGELSKSFPVTVCTDDLYEGAETVVLTLSNPTAPAVLGAPNPAILQIADNDAQPSLQFSAAAYTNGDDFARPGETTKDFAPAGATITVTRTGAVDNAVGVDYATVPGGTANPGAACTAGVDYVATAGTLSFAGGETSKSFTVTVCPDAVFEGDETVDLLLSTPTGGAALGTPNAAVLTITDNDPQPSVQFSAPAYSVGEAGPTATITVTRTGAAGNLVTVDYATGGGTATAGGCAPGVDYIATSGTLSFAPGEISKPIGVTICNDSVYESNQTFGLTLTNPTGGASIGAISTETVTIVNDDAAPTVALADVSQNEGNSGSTSFGFGIVVTGASEVPAGFMVETADGTATQPSDYTALSTTVTAPADVARGTATYPGLFVSVGGDTLAEPDETFFVNSSNCTDCTIADNQAVGTIRNDDPDTTPPAVTYAPLSNIAATSDRTFSVTATDDVGVTAVAVVWVNNGGAGGSSSNPCSFAGGTTWSCTITAGAGVPPQTSPGTVSYFVSANDAAGNSSANPNGGVRNLFTVGSGGTIDVGVIDTFDNLVVGDGFTLTGNAAVGGNLTLSGGPLLTGAGKLTLGCAATVTGAGGANYLIGTIEKQFCGPGSFIFPLGTTPDGAIAAERLAPESNLPEYTPVTANVTSVTPPASLVATVTDGALPGAAPGQSVSRYWDITKVGGALTADLTFRYLDQDVAGIETGFGVLRRSGSTTATYPGGTVNAGANTATAPNVSAFSQWGIGLLVPTA
ncbi:MAG: hypothetical protein JSS81_28390, partial [Acidobacteria bacterium]|nr:hypothetical protein [Acidobacteriota bacterium]